MADKTTDRNQTLKYWRAFQIDAMIRSGEYPNCTDLMNKFEISRSTAIRDLDFLRYNFDAPLEFDAEKNGYYYTDSTFFLQNVMLTEGEVLSLAVIMPLMEQYRNTPLSDAFAGIIEKMTDFMPNRINIDSYYLNGGVKYISDPLPRIDESVFSNVFQAVQLKKTILMDYRSADSADYVRRTADPYSVICQRGNWYVLSYCHEADDMRIYALSRMKNISITKNMFKIPDGFRAEKFMDPSFGIYYYGEKAKKKVELLFSEDIQMIALEKEWHDGQVVKKNDDGSVFVTFETDQMDEVMYLVMQYCGNITVLNPPELRERVKKAAERILGEHK